MADNKVDRARTLDAGGGRISPASRGLRVSRAQRHTMARRAKNRQERQRRRRPDDTDAPERISGVIGELPAYGYCRVWALPRRQSETDDITVINARRLYRIMRQNALQLECNPAICLRNGHIRGKWPSGKATRGGVLAASGSAVIMANTACHVRTGLLRG